MNRTTLRMLCVASFALVAAACSQSAAPVTPGGGTPAGGSTATGGVSSPTSTISTGGSTQPVTSGGSTAIPTGGAAETGGNAVTGGAAPSGGATPSGGNPVTGGAAPSGGAISGGTPKTGGVTASGGIVGGTTIAGGVSASGGTPRGGSTSSGGSPGGATSRGGSTSSGGVTSSGGTTTSTGTTGAGGGMSVAPETVVPDLMGFYWEGTCSGNIAIHGKNCPFAPVGSTSATCASGATWATRGTIRDKVLNVKGTTGTPYTINFEVRGVLGTRCYTGGTAASTATPNASGANNTWYVGGTQANDSIWNTYELHVAPPVPGATANVYYFNAFPANPNWCEKEASFQIGFTASFKVLGGGTMTFEIHDANCMVQQNCGPNEASTTCDAPRTVDLSGMTPAATFTQPPKNTVGSNTFYPQWLYFDVKSVTSP